VSETVEVKVPDIGDFTDVPVIEVLVKPGDTVAKNDSLVVLESDKASMEVPSPVDGTIQTVTMKVGDKVTQGTLIATITATTASAEERPVAAATGDEANKVQQHVIPSAVEGPPPSQALVPRPPAAEGNGVTHATPSTRRFARDLGVGIGVVPATGPNGRVTREDVQSYVKSALQNGGNATGGGNVAFAGLPAWPKVDFAQYGEIERVPLSRIRKLSGPNLHRNWLQIPHITNYDEADITDLEAFRQEINAEQSKSGTKLTLLAFLIKACISAFQKFPEFNSSLDGDSLVLKHYYNIGFAADTANGLIVPVIKNADKKGLLDVGRETAELAAKARDGKLGLGDMQGGTFTISSIGGIGGTQFTQIVNAPEVAILGATRSAMKPVWNGTQFVPRLILPLSVSYDHRVIDGAAAARFLVYLSNVLKDFRRVIL
jgi:pyruvate dehydrogenase E2 component (dihydrolipoamide acetyltransferase)